MKIPQKAETVFDGVIYAIVQWQQQQYDGTMAVFERAIRRPSSAVIAVTLDKKILVAEQQQPTRHTYLSLPGGVKEKDETCDLAAKRELEEETGYTTPHALDLLLTDHGTSKLDFQQCVYIAKDCTKVKEQVLDAGEKITVLEYAVDDFISLCRKDEFYICHALRSYLYECLLDETKKQTFLAKIMS